MEKENIFDGISKWILPALGVLLIAQYVFDFSFTFGA